MFNAASQIVGIEVRLLSYRVCSIAHDADESLTIRTDVEIERGGKIYRGSSIGSDLLCCSLVAWLAAATETGQVVRDVAPLRPRPFQVSGVNKNDDLWIFASSDKETARAIEREFVADEYSEIRFSL